MFNLYILQAGRGFFAISVSGLVEFYLDDTRSPVSCRSKRGGDDDLRDEKYLGCQNPLFSSPARLLCRESFVVILSV